MGKVRLSVGLLIVALGIALLAGFFVYASRAAAPPSPFVSERANLGEKLYRRVTGWDLDGGYPATPSAVMEAYKDTLLLIYGNIIRDDETLKEVLRVQRRFWTEDMLNAATEDEQFNNLTRELAEIYGQDVRLTEVDVRNEYKDPFDEDLTIVATQEVWLRFEDTRHNFYLKTVGGRWLIQSLETVE